MRHGYLIFIVIFFLLLPMQILADDPIAVIIKTKGEVSLKVTKDSDKKVDVKRGTRLYNGNIILTGKDGLAALKFVDDASLVRVRPNSSLALEGEREEKSIFKNLFVEFGTIFSKITQQESSFRVSTPTSVASVKGTAFWTKQEFKGGTYYFGEEGVIEISNDRGAALLKAGETGYVQSSRSKPIVRKTRPGEKPQLEEGESSIDEFKFDFRDEDGSSESLQFKIRKKK